MNKWGLIFLLAWILVVLEGRGSFVLADDEETAGFVQSIEYGNFTVKLGIFDLSRMPEEITDALKKMDLSNKVALVIVTPTSWASDSSNDHGWLIIDTDGGEYRSLDPFLHQEMVEKVGALNARIKRFIYRSHPRHTFAPNKANPLLVFFPKKLPPLNSWERVVFLDIINGFQVDMYQINEGDQALQIEEGIQFL